MMFDAHKQRRRAASLALGALLVSLLIGAGLAGGQEAPRPEGSSQIKPPMIKPPMTRAQMKGGGVKPSSRRRRRVVRRKRRARSEATTVRQIVDVPVVGTENPGQAPSGGGGNAPSIKPPMANNEGSAPLNVPRAPISAGMLNGRAVSLPRPAYPAIARSARASGTVVVQIIIDEEGNVISASAVSGHPLLQSSAVEAARRARFTPTRLEGQPVKVSGTISYNFVL